MQRDPDETTESRRALYSRVTKRGRQIRRRRLAAMATAFTLAISVPIAAAALVMHDDSGTRRVQILAPTTTTETPTTDTATTSESIVPTSAPETSTTAPEVTTTTGTVTAAPCHNSTDPACGPFHYEPPPENQPATMTVVKVAPASPGPGTRVTFTLHFTDPDSWVTPGQLCGKVSFGDGNSEGCGPSCAGTGNRYGPWDPPAPHPSDTDLTVEHVYAKTGTYTVVFTATADQCGPRTSEAGATYTLHVSP
jgi:hypothetical protein